MTCITYVTAICEDGKQSKEDTWINQRDRTRFPYGVEREGARRGSFPLWDREGKRQQDRTKT